MHQWNAQGQSSIAWSDICKYGDCLLKNLILDQNFQNKLLMEVTCEHFDDANDLVRYVQKRTGKLDSSTITSYWLPLEHMLKDKPTLAKYIKFECER